jgi:glucose-6-phosphate 1-dehydrogenase
MSHAVEDFAKLNVDMTAWEEAEDTGANAQNRIFYLAIPPSVFGPSCNSIKTSAMAPTGFTRVIVEKPFGCGPLPLGSPNANTNAPRPNFLPEESVALC